MNTLAASSAKPDASTRAPASYYGDSDKLGRGVAIAVVVAIHVALAWGLLQLKIVRDTLQEAAPLFVSFIDEAKPVAPEPPRPPEQPKPRIVPKKQPAPVLAAPSPTPPKPSDYTVAPQPTEPVRDAIVVPDAPPSPPAPPAAAVQPVAQPKTVSESAVRYLQRPVPEYPKASLKLREEGKVIIRVLVDVNGKPQQAIVAESSGYSRLDEAAVTAVRKALFEPYSENGRALAVWVRVPITFNL